MTKQDVHEIIKAKATEYGFSAEETNWGINGLMIRDEDHTVNFTISVDWAWEERKITLQIRTRSSGQRSW